MIPGKLIDGEMWMFESEHQIAVAPLREQIAALTAERDALRTRVAELEKDAARLNWMENKNTCYYVTVKSQPHGNEIFSNQGVGLRAAIDAAIAALKEVQ